MWPTSRPAIAITGTCCSAIGPGTNAIYNENSFDPSDVVTLIRGKHILKFGGEVLMYQDNATPWGNINAGNFTFSGVFTQRGPNDSTNGLALAKAGSAMRTSCWAKSITWNASNTPIVGFRQKSPQFFVQDDLEDHSEFDFEPRLALSDSGRLERSVTTVSAISTRHSSIPPQTRWGRCGLAETTAEQIWKRTITRCFCLEWVSPGPRAAIGWSGAASESIAITGALIPTRGGSEGLGTNSQGSLTRDEPDKSGVHSVAGYLCQPELPGALARPVCLQRTGNQLRPVSHAYRSELSILI